MKRRRKTPKRTAPKKSRRNLNDNLARAVALQQIAVDQQRLILALKRGRPVGALDDEEEDCPPLPDPNADPDVYICQIVARLDYLLGLLTCAEYKTAYAACTPSS